MTGRSDARSRRRWAHATGCGLCAVSLLACGDLIGVGSLSGGDASSSAEMSDGSSAGSADRSEDLSASGMGSDAVAAGDDGGDDAAGAGPGIDAGRNPADAAEAGCPGVRWVAWTDTVRPPGAFYVGSEPSNGNDPDAAPYQDFVCRARDANDGGDVVPGVFIDKYGCYYTDGTTPLQSATYDILLDPNNCLSWTTYSGDLTRAVLGGRLGSAALYVCRAQLSAQAPFWQPGYLEDGPDASCWVSAHDGVVHGLTMDVTVATQ